LPQIEIAFGQRVERGRFIAHRPKFSRALGSAGGACRTISVRLRNRSAHATLSP
jgi:hypothetical protein